jgi:glutathione reductase (NADPH)
MEQNIKQYDYLVIGAGSGGLASGRRATRYGKKVAIIENKVVGGCCVNVGCVPKKVMYNLANFLEEVHVMKGYGVGGTENLKLDFLAFKKKRDAYIERLHGIYFSNMEKEGVDYVKGTAKFLSDKVIEVSDGQRFTADHILIASGSYPEKNGFEGAEHCMTSDDFFDMEELPQSIVVIGGGYIGIEIA